MDDRKAKPGSRIPHNHNHRHSHTITVTVTQSQSLSQLQSQSQSVIIKLALHGQLNSLYVTKTKELADPT